MSKKERPPPSVNAAYQRYPVEARSGLLRLREYIFEVARSENLGPVEETLKWGEPSYVADTGSPLRLAWNESKPDKLGVYVNCQSKLMDTYKELFGDVFEFEGNRALLIEINSTIPKNEIKRCFLLALTYHSRKNLPLLGA